MAQIDRTPRVTFHGEGDLTTLALEEIEAGIEDALLEEGLSARVVITPLDEEGEPNRMSELLPDHSKLTQIHGEQPRTVPSGNEAITRWYKPLVVYLCSACAEDVGDIGLHVHTDGTEYRVDEIEVIPRAPVARLVEAYAGWESTHLAALTDPEEAEHLDDLWSEVVSAMASLSRPPHLWECERCGRWLAWGARHSCTYGKKFAR